MYIFLKLSTCSVQLSNNICVALKIFDILISPIKQSKDIRHMTWI